MLKADQYTCFMPCKGIMHLFLSGQQCPAKFNISSEGRCLSSKALERSGFLRTHHYKSLSRGQSNLKVFCPRSAITAAEGGLGCLFSFRK